MPISYIYIVSITLHCLCLYHICSDSCCVVSTLPTTCTKIADIAASADSSQIRSTHSNNTDGTGGAGNGPAAVESKLNDATRGAMTDYDYHRRCCNLICLDRNLVAEEAGYRTYITTMPCLTDSAKDEMLVGIPGQWSYTVIVRYEKREERMYY